MHYDWKEQWERHAERQRDYWQRAPLEELLAEVAALHCDTYNTLWDVVGERASLDQAGAPLWNALLHLSDYLERYHCADALKKLAALEHIHLPESVALATDKEPERRLEALKAAHRELSRRLPGLEPVTEGKYHA